MNITESQHLTIAILYPGEMGAALANQIKPMPQHHRQPCRLITYLAERSETTRQAAYCSGIEVLETLSDVVATTDWIISLVPPAHAIETATQVYQSYCQLSPSEACAKKRIYLELNSISPKRVQEIDSLFADSSICLVDGAIHGLASRLTSQGLIYLSGPEAGTVQQFLQGRVNCRNLGEQVGQASALKMLTGGLNKGLAGLFFELLLAAESAGLGEELLAVYRQQYPQIMQVIDRIIPSYDKHIGRRCDELKQMELTFNGWSGHSDVIAAVAKLMAELSQQHKSTNGDGSHVLKLIKRIETSKPQNKMTGD